MQSGGGVFKQLNTNKKFILGFIIGAIIFTGVGVYAANQYNASQITYNKNGQATVDKALDDLYTKAPKKFCELKSGTELTVGSKYECDPGDSTKRNFFVLAVDNNKVKLIMDRNITQGSSTKTMTWNNAMKYFRTGGGASTKSAWTNVQDVDLPMAQDIVNAVGRSNWIAADSGSTWWCFASKAQDSQSAPYCNTEAAKAYNWLYDYTRECNGCTNSLGTTEAYGYWTRDLISNTNYAWRVGRRGNLDDDAVSDSASDGVRPVITVLKSNLYASN